MIPLESVQVQQSEPWLKPKDLAIIRRTNTNDVRCVSWILIKITDQEALDAAIRLAGVIRWFEDGTNVEPPYDLIVSTYEACFNSTGKLYSGSRDKAYYSGRAIMWIHTLAVCNSEEFASTFPLPTIGYTISGLDPDLEHLLLVNEVQEPAHLHFVWLLRIYPGSTPSHSQWISNVLLYLAWANRAVLHFGVVQDHIPNTHETTIPLDAILNRLLVWCIFLGSSVEEEVLTIQDKSCDTPCFCPSSCSHRSSPVIAWNASYINYPKRLFPPSLLPTLNASSSRTYYTTWSIWKTVLGT